MTNNQPLPTSAETGQLPTEGPLELSRRCAAIAMAAVLLLAGGLLTKQIACAKIATLDACGSYLPLAKAYANGDFANSQLIVIPPLYPMVVGSVSRLLPWAQWPQELAGRLVSAFFTLVLVLIVYWIGAKGWNRRVGLGAAALTAVNHDIILFGASVGPDLMYAALLAIAVLGLAYYVGRPTLASSMLIGLAAALAALTRSEGLFLPALAAAIMVAIVLIRRPPGSWRVVIYVLAMLCVVAAVWWPRTSYMHEKTGYYAMDARLIKYLPARHPAVSIDTNNKPNQIGSLDAIVPPNKPDMVKFFTEAQDSLLMGFGPLAWILALCWFLCPRNIPRNGLLQIAIFVVILAEVLIVSYVVKLGHRYAVTVTGLAQIWGGLGMVAVAEFARLRTSSTLSSAGRLLNRFCGSLKWQMVVLGLISAGLACWSLFAANTGSRRVELRELAQIIVQDSGPGQVIMASSGSHETGYYASGKLVIVRRGDDTKVALPLDELTQACRKYSVRYIIFRSDEKWLPAEVFWIRGVIVAQQESPDKAASGQPMRYYLIDARKLNAMTDHLGIWRSFDKPYCTGLTPVPRSSATTKHTCNQNAFAGT